MSSHNAHTHSFQNSSKEMSIVKLPEVLCIHLKRFRFDTYFSGKISRHIAFPLSGLDMSAYLKQGAPTAPLYELSAVITHYGGAGGEGGREGVVRGVCVCVCVCVSVCVCEVM